MAPKRKAAATGSKRAGKKVCQQTPLVIVEQSESDEETFEAPGVIFLRRKRPKPKPIQKAPKPKPVKKTPKPKPVKKTAEEKKKDQLYRQMFGPD